MGARHPDGFPSGYMTRGPRARPGPPTYGVFGRTHVCRIAGSPARAGLAGSAYQRLHASGEFGCVCQGRSFRPLVLPGRVGGLSTQTRWRFALPESLSSWVLAGWRLWALSPSGLARTWRVFAYTASRCHGVWPAGVFWCGRLLHVVGTSGLAATIFWFIGCYLFDAEERL